MKFRQKPPTKPGIYWALSEDGDEPIPVEVVSGFRYDGSVYYSVHCWYDCGSDCVDHGDLKDFRLWSVDPVAIPKFKMPTRWINYHKEPSVKLPPSCRRHGHKYQVVEDNAGSAFKNTVEKCIRCGHTISYNKMLHDAVTALLEKPFPLFPWDVQKPMNGVGDEQANP